MRALRIISILLLLQAVGGDVLSQGAPDLREQERQRLVLFASSILKEVAAAAPVWKSSESAVAVLTDAADVLWNEEPEQSKRWLTKAWEIANQASTAPADEKLKSFFTRSAQSRLRSTVLSIARKHDPKLAEELLKQTIDSEVTEKRERGAFDDRTARSEQLLNLAQQLVSTNPEGAFELARESLADGLSFRLQDVLTALRQKNLTLANNLFDAALARFAASMPDPSEAQVLAGYLFQPGVTLAANSQGGGMLVLNPAQQSVRAVAQQEPERSKRYLTLVYQSLLAPPQSTETPEGKQRAQQLLILGSVVGRQYPIYAPDLATPAQSALLQLQRQLLGDAKPDAASENTSSDSNASSSTKPLSAEERYTKDIDDLLLAAEKQRSGLFRDVAYSRVVVATKASDYERAKVIAQRIDDTDLRADAISFALYRASLYFVDKGDITRASNLGAAIQDPPRQAVAKIAIAQKLVSLAKGNELADVSAPARLQIIDLLNDAGRLFKNADPSVNGARILLARAALLSHFDPNQALAALAESVHMINKLESFDLRAGAAPSLGMSSVSASSGTVSSPRAGFGFESAVEPLVSADFEQVAAVAGTLSAKELNGLARVQVAKLYLSKNGKPNLK
jgi:hypothetical protein